VDRLTDAGGEEHVHFGSTDGEGKELASEGNATPECFELIKLSGYSTDIS